MEDPTTFDVWIERLRRDGPTVEDIMGDSRAGLTRLQLLKELSRSKSEQGPLLLAQDAPWSKVGEVRKRLRERGLNAVTIQADYPFAERWSMSRCETHDLFYAGVLECPVCGGRGAP